MNDETRQLIQKLRTLEERVAQLEAANLSLSAADILASVQTTGTWTPALAFGGASTGITYSGRSGAYIKFGGIVFISAYIGLSNKGTATGEARITGLPYTVNGSLFWPARWVTANTAFVQFVAFAVGGATQIGFRYTTAANASLSGTPTNAQFTNTTEIYAAGFYLV